MKLRRLDLRSNKMSYKPKQDFADLITFYDKDENPVVVIDTVNKRLSGSFGGDWVGDFPISGAMSVDGNITATGTITAQEFNTELTNVSVIYQSGSTKFGDTADDIHSFTGSFYVVGDISGSNLTTGTIHGSIISGSIISGSVISGSFVGDGSALTYDMATTTIYGNIISGSIISGSTISGSFVGDGSGLTGVGVNAPLTDGKNIQDFSYSGAVAKTVALEDDINIENLTISSSVFNKVVISESGSTNFGNDINDLHTITGSVKLQNSIEWDTASGTSVSLTGLVAAGKLSGSISGSDLLRNTNIDLGELECDNFKFDELIEFLNKNNFTFVLGLRNIVHGPSEEWTDKLKEILKSNEIDYDEYIVESWPAPIPEFDIPDNIFILRYSYDENSKIDKLAAFPYMFRDFMIKSDWEEYYNDKDSEDKKRVIIFCSDIENLVLARGFNK